MDTQQGITPQPVPLRDHAHHVELVFTTDLVVGPDENPEDVAAHAYESLDGQMPGYTRLIWACHEEGLGGVWESYPRDHDHEEDV